MLANLPPTFADTRESLRAVACYAISPARKALTGRIGLRAHEGGIATPPFEDGTRIAVHGDELRTPSGEVVRLTTVSAAAAALGVEVSPDPGVGHDLPPFEPDRELPVDRAASLALGAWYAFADATLGQLADALPSGVEMSEAQLWPEHFDLAVVVSNAAGVKVNVGFSPGDTFRGEPYAYVGPHDPTTLDRSDGYWNAPFGATLPYRALAGSPAPEAKARRFIDDGLNRLSL